MTMMMSGENIGFCCRECFLAIWGPGIPYASATGPYLGLMGITILYIA